MNAAMAPAGPTAHAAAHGGSMPGARSITGPMVTGSPGLAAATAASASVQS